MSLASTKIKDIDGDAYMIIAQATKEENFIWEFPDGSSPALEPNQGQSNNLILILDSGSVVSRHNKVIVEKSVGRGEVKGGRRREAKTKIAAGLSIQEDIKR